MPGGSFAWRRLTEYLDESRDLFGQDMANVTQDLIDVPGEREYSPERLRYYKDGVRRFLQYGTDANYSEVPRGRLLSPDPDQTLTITTAERGSYPVGADLMPSQSYRINRTPQAGDVVAVGYGIPDLANFDPVTVTYSAGSDADGWFIYHTEATALEEAIIAGVDDGTVYYSDRVDIYKPADVLAINEIRLNWYGVGPGKFLRSFTDIADFPNRPNQNKVIGHVANDDGPSSKLASHRPTFSIHQAAGNDGFEMTSGSVSLRASSDSNFQFKAKGHEMALENTNTTDGTFQVLGALRHDPARPGVKLRLLDLDITRTPGTEINDTKVLIIAAAPESMNAPASGTWETPVEHNPQNSVLQQVEVAGDAVTPLTGPVQDAAGTDVNGADTANTMTNPGGYQMGRETIDVEGTGSKTNAITGQQSGNRELYDTDIALILVDSDTAGTVKLQVQTEQNS